MGGERVWFDYAFQRFRGSGFSELNSDTSLPKQRLSNQDESVSGAVAGLLGERQQPSLPVGYLVLPFVLTSLI